ncbi:MAG TPA: hypothetical protein VKA37_13255, partial [Halobacteriales archaeon]|nr:hypothetical protein [Halobacteriales archaeon]
DHPSVTTLRGELVRRGGTRRPAVEVSPDDREALPTGRTVRLVVDGRERHAPVDERGGTRAFLGAYDNARLARERDGRERLAEWVEARGLEFGRSVLVDVVDPGEVYGLRAPGEDVVYEVERGPAESLRRIAEDLES